VLAHALKGLTLFVRLKPSQLEIADPEADDWKLVKAAFDEGVRGQKDAHLGRAALVRALAGSRPSARKEAVVAGELAVKTEPKNAWAHFALARAKALSEEETGSGVRTALDAAIRLDPKVACFWSERGIVKRNEADLDGALDDAAKAIALDAKDPTAWFVKALVLHDRRKWTESLAAASTLLELDENHRLGSWLVGDGLLETNGDVNEALKHLNYAVGLTNSFFPAIRSLVRALVKADNAAMAHTVLENYLTRMPKSAPFRKEAEELRDGLPLKK
ncbi:MAG: tetratricopeptide repeat protein, partial [Planctomycetota bacterium]